MLKSFFKEHVREAGLDEAGRGCLAGPVVAAAVILPPEYKNTLLNDSKKLTPKLRFQLREEIKANALAWSVAVASAEEIDEINILNASLLAMHRALDGLSIEPEHLLVDGNRFRPYKDVAQTCVVRGDGLYLSVAAASVLAKTHRDELMTELAEQFPGYGWERNFGYPTSVHRRAVDDLGITPYHRKSFGPVRRQLALFA